jgi:hypothetical protein
MKVLIPSLVLFCAASRSSPECENDVALLQLNSRESSADLSPLERFGPNVHRHKLAFSEANVTLSTTEPSYRELAGYWTGEDDTARALAARTPGGERHAWPPTPSEARALLEKDRRIMGYSYEKVHPDVAYVRTSGATFVPSEDWVSVMRAEDNWDGPTKGLPEGTATTATSKQIFQWENPPPDHIPLKADEDETVEGPDSDPPEASPLVVDENVSANDTSSEHPGSVATVAAVGLLAALSG